MTEYTHPLIAPGRAFGDFELVRPLGEGGGGQVWESRDLGADRSVALKILTGVRAESETARERFRREARLAAAVRHPNCVYVLRAHEISGLLCISMELMKSGTLADLLAERPVGIDEAVTLVLEVMSGLEAAHQMGVIHRDIKPSNCFMGGGGSGAKLGDFGVSRVLDEASDLSATGGFLGTFHFASPEQIRGDDLDERSDLYSLGATLYQLLTGRRPFEGSPMAVAAQIIADTPPAPSTLNPAIPSGLDRVCLRLLEKDRDRRYADCAALRSALQPFVPETRSLAPAGIWSRIIAYQLDVGLLLASLLLLGAGLAGLENTGLTAFAQDGVLALMKIGYFSLAEHIWGRSLGKWVLGLRVIDASGKPPEMRPALIRALVFASIGLLAATAHFVPIGAVEVGALETILVSALLATTMRPSNGRRCPHDLISGTSVVVHKPSDGSRARTPASLPFKGKPIAVSTPLAFGPYVVRDETVDAIWETGDEGLLRAWDRELDRPVWIRFYRNVASAPDLGAFKEIQTGRLVWLAGSRDPKLAWDAFRTPPGYSLVDWVQAHGPIAWNEVRELVSAMTDLFLCTPPSTPSTFDLSRVWVEAPGRVLVLDFPTRPSSDRPPISPEEWIRRVAYYSLEGVDGPPADQYEGPALPISLSAREFLRRLFGPEQPWDLGEIKSGLEGLGPASVTPNRRLALVTAGALIPVLLALTVSLGAEGEPRLGPYAKSPGAGYLAYFADQELTAARLGPRGALMRGSDSLRVGRLLALRDSLGTGAPSGVYERAAHTAFGIRDGDSQDLSSSPGWAYFLSGLEALSDRHPAFDFTVPAESWHDLAWVVALGYVGAMGLISLFAIGSAGLFATAISFASRGGVILAAGGIVVLLADGRRAGRTRCALRTLVAWSPWILGGIYLMERPYNVSQRFQIGGVGVDEPVATITAVALSLLITSVGLSLVKRSPTRGLPERITRTVLARR